MHKNTPPLYTGYIAGGLQKSRCGALYRQGNLAGYVKRGKMVCRRSGGVEKTGAGEVTLVSTSRWGITKNNGKGGVRG